MKKLIISILASLLLSGCFHAKPVERQKYMLNLKTPPTITNHRGTEYSIYIAPTTIVPQFAGANFVYLTKNNIYVADYYNEFFIPPANQVHQAVINHFTDNAQAHVLEGTNIPHTADYLLKTKVLSLYADYQNSKRPTAVMSIQFALYDLKKKTGKLMYQNIVTEKTPLNAKTSASLVAAWNIDLQKILSRLKLNP